MPKFNRRHYEAIAKVIRETDTDYACILTVANDLADMFKEDNPNFDRKRFLKAADIEIGSSNERT